jgi:hypothetical protein
MVSGLANGQETITITATDDCGETAETTIQFMVTPVEIVNPKLTINEPTGTSINLVEGEELTIDFDSEAQDGNLITTSAEINDTNSGTVGDVIPLTNSGNNFTGTWVSIEGTYDLVITSTNDMGGVVTKTISVTVTAPVASRSVVISSITEGDILLNPGDIELTASVSQLGEALVTDILFVLKNIKTNAITPIDGDLSTMSTLWYTTSPGDYIVNTVVTLSDGSTLNSPKINFSVEIETAITTIDGVTEILAYPNPFTDHFAVQIEAIQSQETEVTVYNVVGTPISTEQIYVSSGSNQLDFDTSDWSSGMYIIMINSNSGVYSIKIEK